MIARDWHPTVLDMPGRIAHMRALCASEPGLECRRRGLMHQLLEGAVRHAQAMGATALEGYPVDPGSERVDQTSG